MKKMLIITNPTRESWISRAFQRAKCIVGCHDYQLHQQFGEKSSRIICPYCRGDWAHVKTDDHELTNTWGADFHQLYEAMGYRIEPLPWDPVAFEERVEELAKGIYSTWIGAEEYPWNTRGNSHKQHEARKQARAQLKGE